MSTRRSRRLAGLDPVNALVNPNYKSVIIAKPSQEVNKFQMISQYIFFLIWASFILRGFLFR